MTDKEIFEKLEAEIERLENYENESVTSSDTRFGWIHGKTFALTSIRVLLDSMQKEPISEKVCMYSKDNYTAEDRKALCDGCKEECKFNKKEEPVSEGLEAAIDNYLATYFGGEKEKQEWPFLKKMAIHFAAWQKQQLMAKAVDVTIAIPYPNGYGGYTQLVDSKEGLPFGENLKVLVIKKEIKL